MSVGGFFLLLVALIVVGILGWWLYVLIMWLRGRQLHPDGDKVEPASEQRSAPDHVTVENEQKTHFVGSSHGHR